MATVVVTAKLDNLKRLQRNITKVNLSEGLAKEFASTLRTVVKQRSPRGTGELSSNIKHRVTGRYGAGVYAPYYFWMANNGRAAGRMPPDKQSEVRFRAYAAKNNISPGKLAWLIGKHGTKKNAGHYYEAAMQIFKVKKPRAYKKILKAK